MLEELQERQHVWDAVSEGQRDSNEAREKGMGLMVQGLEDCGIESGLDFQWHSLMNTHLGEILSGCCVENRLAQVKWEGRETRGTAAAIHIGSEVAVEMKRTGQRPGMFPPWSSEDGRDPTLQSVL